MAGIKRIDFSNIDTTGVSAGQQAVYIAANSRFEFVAADYVAVAGGGGGGAPSAPVVLLGQTSIDIVGGRTTGNASLLDIERLPISSDSNSTDVGELNAPSDPFATGSMSSETDGYYGGGPAYNPSTSSWTYFKKSFASTSGSVSASTTGYSNPLHGYSYGINADPSHGIWFGRSPAGGNSSKFNYSSDSMSNPGWVTQNGEYQFWVNTSSSPTHGYLHSGSPGGSGGTGIDKFPFSTGGSLASVGDLTVTHYTGSGTQSDTHGYSYGGYTPTNTQSAIDKFPFSSDTNGIDIAELSPSDQHAYLSVGAVGSATHGYSCGGSNRAATTIYGDIIKFSFSSDSNGVDIGQLIAVKRVGSGTSV